VAGGEGVAPNLWLAEYRREPVLRVLPDYDEQLEPVRAYLRAHGRYRSTAGFGEHEDITTRLLAVIAESG
jgi:hypothetical protein